MKNGKTTVDYNDGDVSEHNFKTEEYKVLALPNQPFSFTTLCDIAPSYLTCPICLEILDKPQTLKTCMHTFCSVCITRINNCATCGLPFQESDVASNPIITTLSAALQSKNHLDMSAAMALSTMVHMEKEQEEQRHKDRKESKERKDERNDERKDKSEKTWRCRKCGKQKAKKQTRCGVGCK